MITPDLSDSLAVSGGISLSVDERRTIAQSHQILVSIVQKVTNQVPDEALASVGRWRRQLAFQPRALLALLTYYYVARIYGSEEIEAAMRNDSSLCFLCANNIPDWHTLRRFRYRNRGILEYCVAQSLQLAQNAQGLVQYRKLNQAGSTVGEAEDPTETNRLDQSAAMEATARIERAAWLDSVALVDRVA